MQYKLKTPFKFGNETVTEVTLKDAFNAGDMAFDIAQPV